MFHMLTCFNLKPEFSMDDFRKSVTGFTKHMQDNDLAHSTGPIGRRQSDTIMDTDNERNHKFFFIIYANYRINLSDVENGRCSGSGNCRRYRNLPLYSHQFTITLIWNAIFTVEVISSRTAMLLPSSGERFMPDRIRVCVG